MDELSGLSASDRGFLDAAITTCDSLGPDTALLLVGSRAAGFSGPHSDLDLWIVGDRDSLPAEHREAFDRDGSVFVDRGDYDAHWTFYDKDILTEDLGRWLDEKVWILSTSKHVHGSLQAFDDLKARFSRYPQDVAESKLKWLIGTCRTLFSSFPKSGDSKPIAGIMVVGRIIECLYKICCVADRVPIPYTKWLAKVAEDTRLAGRISQAIDETTEALAESPLLPEGLLAPDWRPRAHLKQAFDRALLELPALGWNSSWISEPWEAASESLKRPSP